MQVARTLCRGQLGLRAPLVQVEVHLGSGLPTFSIVGLPAAAVRESRQRVRAAVENCGFEFPAGRITVNLAPADLPKEGGRFDLAIALGILLASGQLRSAQSDPLSVPDELYGELSLSGELKPIRGLLPAAAQAASLGHDMLVPSGNIEDVLVVAEPATVHAASHLTDVCAYLRGESSLSSSLASRTRSEPRRARGGDLGEVRGQHAAKRALVIAAAGGHSLLMIGPPGSGKSMLAQRLPALLPPMTRAEALEVAMIASVSHAGFDARRFGERPFRAPHHTASGPSLVGGGPRALPGEASLAHRGVLFLDELPEFDRRVLETLREPLETRTAAVSRARMHTQYPAAFQLIAAMNPCPCGYLGDSGVPCRCTPGEIERYRARVSGPLLDPIDMVVEAARVPIGELATDSITGETTATAAAQVALARSRQLARGGKANADLSAAELHDSTRLSADARSLLERAFNQLNLTARSYHRVLRVARTIADLAAADRIEAPHMAEAVQLRRQLIA